MLCLVPMIVLCVEGSIGLRLEGTGLTKESTGLGGSQLGKVKATVKKELMEARSGGEEVGDEKEEVERGNERRKKKRRLCRGKTKGAAFKVSGTLCSQQ